MSNSNSNSTPSTDSTDAESHSTIVAVESSKTYDAVPEPANGDPYIAHVSETAENGVPIQTVSLTLGTGFTSIEEIARHVRRRLADPDYYGDGDAIPADFTPDRADVFGLHGHISFTDPESNAATATDTDSNA